MAISVSLMSAALCRAFLQLQEAPKLSGYLSDQYVEFEISWQGKDLQGEEIGDIFMAASKVFENTAQIVTGKIDTPRQNGHGIIVRIGYPYPLPWYAIGRKPNSTFARQLAINDIARCLDLINSSPQTQRLLQKAADPSVFPYRFWRSYLLSAERQRREKAHAKVAKLRAKRKSDFA
jgi:hypothetical protein